MIGAMGDGAISQGVTTEGGRTFTKYGADQANDRGYTANMVDSIVDNWTNKAYQPEGRIVYGQRKKDVYHVFVLDKDNNIISVIGGATAVIVYPIGILLRG